MENSVSGYSADFRGHLVVGEFSYPLARLDAEELGLAQPMELAPTDAEIVLVIDGREYRRPIQLPQGSSATLRKIPYRSISTLVRSELP